MKTTLKNRFLEFVLGKGLFQPGERVLVAVSGGIDSMVLLHLLYHCRQRLKISLGVVHLHHQIRKKTADLDQQLVKRISHELEIPVWSLTQSLPGFARQQGLSLEEAGHVLRRKLFQELADKQAFQKIATGHHLDDQAETVLMRLITGTGLSGLAGIRLQKGQWVRPLLFASRGDIEQYASWHKLLFRTDETNLDVSILRNKIRLELLPLLMGEYNPQVSRHLTAIAGYFAEWEESFQQQVDQAFQNYVKLSPQNKIEVGIPVFKFYFSGIIIRLIDKIIGQLGVMTEPLSSNQFNDFAEWVQKGKTGGNFRIRESVVAYKRKEKIVFTKSLPAIQRSSISQLYPDTEPLLIGSDLKVTLSQIPVHDVVFSPDRYEEYLEGDRLNFPLSIRLWKPGDRFVPLGLTSSKLISDFLTDLKIGQPEKKRVYVVVNGEEIVAVLGFQISDQYKVNRKSNKVYRLKLETVKP